MLKVGDIVGGIYPNIICGKTVMQIEFRFYKIRRII